MKRKRYLVVILFVLLAVVLFFIGKPIDNYIFLQYAPEDDLISQFVYGFNLRLVLYGVYVLLLLSLSMGGYWISKRKGVIEYTIGFRITAIASSILLLAYLVLLLYVKLG